MENGIKVSDSDNKEFRLIELAGSLDSDLSAELEDVLTQQESLSGSTIRIDMGKVSEVTPEGVRVLLNASLAQNQQGALQLQNPNERVRQLMETVGLATLISD